MTHLPLAAQEAVILAQDAGILDWTETKLGELGTLFRTFSIVAGIGFVIFQAIRSGGAMARIVISGLAAAIFVWIVFNVTDLRDRVDTEVNAAAPGAATSGQV